MKPNYSGKSSLVLLLLRLLDPLSTCGEKITIDDTPLHLIDRPTLRQRIIAVPQDPVFLPDGTSLQANLDTQGQSTEAECSAVLELVGLRAIIDESNDGLAGALAAESLSQGQKQLFSLARAILRRRARSRAREAALREKGVNGQGGVLLLDEFSSGVDRETEKVMQKVIDAEFKGYTVVMVSHRLDMVMDFDTVIIMHGGRIVETGRPRDLAQMDGSRFGELWKVDAIGKAT
jgi:ATP-binding cassette subfamily C (CFTR/MRP) protein 1